MGRKVSYIKDLTKEYVKKLNHISIISKPFILENEFIELVNNGLQNKLEIGTKVILQNAIGTDTNWVVADVNHDGINGTVDLVAEHLLQSKDNPIHLESYGNSNIYQFSDIRTWLNEVFIEGFTEEIKRLLKPIEVITEIYGSPNTTIDKVKLPSMTELGITSHNVSLLPEVDEGSMYPIFDKGISNVSNKKRIKCGRDEETTEWWWTRTKFKKDSHTVCVIGQNGGFTTRDTWTSPGGVIPIIRF